MPRLANKFIAAEISRILAIPLLVIGVIHGMGISALILTISKLIACYRCPIVRGRSFGHARAATKVALTRRADVLRSTTQDTYISNACHICEERVIQHSKS